MIYAFPQPHPASFLGRPSLPGGLRRYTGVFASGRAAIYWALKGLHLAPGSVVWMPAFHCGVEVEAALALGHEVRFYRIDENLAVDVSDLGRRLSAAPGPVLVIHYFGFPQPAMAAIARLCRERNVCLIEDCAHALFSRDAGGELGRSAPVAIFSFRKTLPLLDGGALSIDAEALGRPFHAPAMPTRSGAMPFAKYSARKLLGSSVTNIYRALRWGASGSVPAASPAPPSWRNERYDAPCTTLSRRIAERSDPALIVGRRRGNWLALHDALSGAAGYRPVFPALADGVCPLVLPIWIEGREEVAAALARSGVDTFVFGAVPHPDLDLDKFPEVRRMQTQILGLPVQQDLRAGDVSRIASALLPALSAQSAPAQHAWTAL